MERIAANLSELIGQTPLLELRRIATAQQLEARIFAKLEGNNPAGSVKDRIALNMLNTAEEQGLLDAETVIVEPTSGNTGIGLAALAAARGYRLILCMPESMSVERRAMLQIYGAELELTEAAKGMKGAIQRAEELAASLPKAWIPGQFANAANPEAHYQSTGPEIAAAFNEASLRPNLFVAGVGTGGTLSGTGRYLKEQFSDLRVVAVEPAASPVLSGGAPGPHKIQGIGAGFVPDNFMPDVCDEIIQIENDAAIRTARELARSEGLAVGISSGAALAAAIELSKRPKYHNTNICVILPDRADRYLSTDLFKGL